MNGSEHVKYLAINSNDLLWGLAVNSTGWQDISPGEDYPPHNHPNRYLFSYEKGRKLDEYQLIYITRGGGEFSSEALGRDRKVRISAGDMLLLFPGEWHTYKPFRDTGWKEYWIGFQGDFAESLYANGFLKKDKPVFHVGIHNEMAELYEQAVSISIRQLSGFQQALHGIASNLISLAYYYDRNFQFKGNDLDNTMNKAKILIDQRYASVSPEEVASGISMGYSNFRKVFKSYTGFSPGQYIQEVRLSKSKEMLTNTSLTIKEIAFNLGYENDYFFTVFRRRFGMTPLQYRDMTQGRDL